MLAELPEASVMMGVPTFYTRLLGEAGLTREAAAHVRLFISGSAPLSPATHAEWQARTGHAILERYGMTETNMITSNPYDGARRAGTVGMPLPGYRGAGDRDPKGAMPVGEAGAIEVRGPNVFKGYWRLPEKTAEEFRDGWFVTGDLGAFDARGLSLDPWSGEGSGDHRGPERLSRRSRGGFGRPSGRCRLGGHRRPASGFR